MRLDCLVLQLLKENKMEFIPLITSVFDAFGPSHGIAFLIVVVLIGVPLYSLYLIKLLTQTLKTLNKDFSNFVKDHEKVHDKIGNTLDEVKDDVKNLNSRISDIEKHQAIIETKLDERTK